MSPACWITIISVQDMAHRPFPKRASGSGPNKKVQTKRGGPSAGPRGGTPKVLDEALQQVPDEEGAGDQKGGEQQPWPERCREKSLGPPVERFK